MSGPALSAAALGADFEPAEYGTIAAALAEVAQARVRESRSHRWIGPRFADVRKGLRSQAAELDALAGRARAVGELIELARLAAEARS